MAQGVVLLLFYSLGLAVPFLVAALAVERFIKWFQRYRQYMPLVTKVSGGILLFLGLLLLSGYFSLLASWLQGLTPDFLRDRI
jgi:cytochrome c-type biogenesis protein